MWSTPQFSADLVLFNEEILNGKLQFLYSVNSQIHPWKSQLNFNNLAWEQWIERRILKFLIENEINDLFCISLSINGQYAFFVKTCKGTL